MNLRYLLFYLFFATSLVNIHAQKKNELPTYGGGEYVTASAGACLTAAERSRIQARIDSNIQELRAQGKLPMAWSKSTTSLEWPMQTSNALDFQNYYGISGFVDQASGTGIRDYRCGNRSYDGHQGTDYFTWPFPWLMYELDYVSVVAAAPGTIVFKDENEEDDHCSWEGRWNAVYVAHGDGTVAWYGHLKQFGLTSKEVGETIETGEFVGYVASSGRSTGPHLHLEIRSASGGLIDPYDSSCDNLESGVNWVNQQAYRAPQINALLTHGDLPESGCPAVNEHPNIKTAYEVGELIYVAVYYKDQLQNTTANFVIRSPSGAVVFEWDQISPNTYNASWWWWSRSLGVNAEEGEYTVEVSYEGQQVVRTFTYGTVSSTTNEVADIELSVGPNPTTGNIYLSKELPVGTVIKIHNRAGQLLEQHVLEGRHYEMRDYPVGLYFLSFEHGGRLLSTQRLILKH